MWTLSNNFLTNTYTPYTILITFPLLNQNFVHGAILFRTNGAQIDTNIVTSTRKFFVNIDNAIGTGYT